MSPKTTAGLTGLRPHKYAALTTFRRSGAAVTTPVTIAVDGEVGYFRTYHSAGKAKRLRNFPNVLVAPSTFRGTPVGDQVPVSARLLSGVEVERARRAIAARQPFLQGVLVPVLHRLMRYRTLHYALTPGHVEGGSPTVAVTADTTP